MAVNLKGRHFLSMLDFSTEEIFGVLDTAKKLKSSGAVHPTMQHKGLTYSGEHGFAETEMWWRINHMVAPKEQALGCMDCHGQGDRLDWEALGYEGDPMRSGKRKL